MTVTLCFRARRVGRAMCWIAVIVAALGFLGDWLGSTSSSEFIWPILRQFDFVEEGNLVNWYQSGTLMLCAVLAAAVASVARQRAARFRWHWAGIAAVFVFLSADECAQLHETTLSPFLQDAAIRLGHGAASGAAGDEHVGPAMKKAYWMLPYGVALAALALAYARFFLDLTPAVRRYFFLAAALFLSGAVGAELVTNLISDFLGGQTRLYQIINNGAEMLEMLGVAVFIKALLLHLAESEPAGVWRIERD